ncbi:unnamed protein product [Clonostachys solani]|uniref:Uncharacterized protein n=1 Tax=Clonostachys solani TaxID=160281 RepID=A0A9N9ZPE8_9HYPO|nr:unnamed protein product [Clonostachys solani]
MLLHTDAWSAQPCILSTYALIVKYELKAAAAQAEVELIFQIKKTEHHEKYLVWQLEKPHNKEAGETGVALS